MVATVSIWMSWGEAQRERGKGRESERERERERERQADRQKQERHGGKGSGATQVFRSHSLSGSFQHLLYPVQGQLTPTLQ
jgi:hypothetical protein